MLKLWVTKSTNCWSDMRCFYPCLRIVPLFLRWEVIHTVDMKLTGLTEASHKLRDEWYTGKRNTFLHHLPSSTTWSSRKCESKTVLTSGELNLLNRSRRMGNRGEYYLEATHTDEASSSPTTNQTTVVEEQGEQAGNGCWQTSPTFLSKLYIKGSSVVVVTH